MVFPTRYSPLMTEKVLYCIPVYYGVVGSLIFQFVVDTADASWLLWWLVRTHNDDVEPIKTLIGCSLALAIWELYAAFIASVGLYGALARKRFMKSYWKPQIFVWICHIGICVWYIIVYYQINKSEVQDCEDKVEEDSDDEQIEECRHILGYRGAPLPYIWVTFIVEAVVQTVVFYFLWQYRRVLNGYKVVNTEDVAHLAENGEVLDSNDDALVRPSIPLSSPHRRGSSEVTLVPTIGSAVRNKTLA